MNKIETCFLKGVAFVAPIEVVNVNEFNLRYLEDQPNPILSLNIQFQHGNPSEVGRNGWTNEELLLILAYRLNEFNKGEFSSRENLLAITKLEEALMWLQKRTERRIAENKEGTQTH